MTASDGISKIVVDIENDLTEFDASIKALLSIVSQSGDAGIEPAGVPYHIALILTEKLEEDHARLKGKWDRLWDLTRPEPDGVVAALDPAVRKRGAR